jgi:murein L,D-transpeptidase YcbB/YkuD
MLVRRAACEPPNSVTGSVSALALFVALMRGGVTDHAEPLQPTLLGTAGLEAARDVFVARSRSAQPPPIASGRTLSRGSRGEQVLRIRRRLLASGEEVEVAGEGAVFDDPLDAAVRRFQTRHGLDPDGKVGPRTRAELNVGPRERIRQIDRVIASRRALPEDLGERFVLVNLPAFELTAVDRRGTALDLAIVIGSAARPTPEFVGRIVTIVTHPAWRVPPRIAREEIAVRARDDPDYLARLGFEVTAIGGGSPIDPRWVDWTAFERGEARYEIVQRPGPLNALGEVAFRLENAGNVLLHDTPERHLFRDAYRARSHGCVRVQAAADLARWLLAGGAPGSPAPDLVAALADAGRTSELPVGPAVPIYAVDWPVWIDRFGVLQVRPEVYAPRAAGEAIECAGDVGVDARPPHPARPPRRARDAPR